ncbi:MAG: 2Fe-2S iron-sulfur cluster binding domain-containing protein [Bacteroidetes bacterium]|jgi:ferredoxin|nr:2Fe-2S iron-sulfur cluster binding domain-containing protein [Bacteroidota bacterium]
MPILNIEDAGSFDVPEGQRLANAIEDCGVDIGHRCGGKARCTTCRVTFTEGEPTVMTRAEYEKLKDRDLLGEVRLSCQIVVDRPMAVTPLMKVEEMGWDDPGPDLAPTVEPEAEWFARNFLEAEGA